MDTLQYPLGTFDVHQTASMEDRRHWLSDIAKAPQELAKAVEGLGSTQLDTSYRSGGWTVRQVVHHVPDSHMNAYIRFKLALTEEHPTIRPYAEDRFAQLADYKHTPVETSLALLRLLHERWSILLRGMSERDYKRTYYHPEMGALTLEQATGLYAWHGKHHTAHITTLRQRMHW